jgi:hypothetical protein
MKWFLGASQLPSALCHSCGLSEAGGPSAPPPHGEAGSGPVCDAFLGSQHPSGAAGSSCWQSERLTSALGTNVGSLNLEWDLTDAL